MSHVRVPGPREVVPPEEADPIHPGCGPLADAAAPPAADEDAGRLTRRFMERPRAGYKRAGPVHDRGGRHTDDLRHRNPQPAVQ